MTARRGWLLALAALAALAAAGGPARGAGVTFGEVAEGVAYAPLALPELSGHAFDVDLARATVRLVAAGRPGTRASVASLAAPHPVHLAVNASFFDEAGRPLGRAVADGVEVGRAAVRAWGALVVDGGFARVLPGHLAPATGDVVVQGVPRLVVAGAVPALKAQVARRTAACAAGARLTLVVIAAPVEAATLARFLARPRAEGGLGCADALNLDGGSSTQLSARLPGLSLSIEGSWPVPNALVVIPAAAPPVAGSRP